MYSAPAGKYPYEGVMGVALCSNMTHMRCRDLGGNPSRLDRINVWLSMEQPEVEFWTPTPRRLAFGWDGYGPGDREQWMKINDTKFYAYPPAEMRDLRWAQILLHPGWTPHFLNHLKWQPDWFCLNCHDALYDLLHDERQIDKKSLDKAMRHIPRPNTPHPRSAWQHFEGIYGGRK